MSQSLVSESGKTTVIVSGGGIGKHYTDLELESLKAEYRNMLRIAELAKQEAEQAKAAAQQTAYDNTAVISSQQKAIELLTNTNTKLVQQFDDYDADIASRIDAIVG